MPHFGNVLKTFRAEEGINQQELATRLGISRCYLSQIERGVATNISFALGAAILNLWNYHGTVEVVLPRRIEIDVAIAPEIVWLNAQGVMTDACCAGPPPTAVIRPSSVKRAQRLGYRPEYRERTGLYEMMLKSSMEPR